MSTNRSEEIKACGVRLHVEVQGDGEPVLLLHGFSGCASTLRPLAEGLKGYTTLGVDLLGHGRSEIPEDEPRHSMESAIAQLCSVLDHFDIQRTHIVGYSMGGRLALGFATTHPERVRSLTTIGASAGLPTQEEREERVANDATLANFIVSEGIESFAKRWTALPLFASQEILLSKEQRAALREQRLANDPLGLARSLRGMGTGAQPPLHGQLRRLTMPVLLVAGEADVKFRVIAEKLGAEISNSEVAVIPDAGHAVHIENPKALVNRVREFLAKTSRAPRA